MSRALFQRAHSEGWTPHKDWDAITDDRFNWLTALADKYLGVTLKSDDLRLLNVAEAHLWIKGYRYGENTQRPAQARTGAATDTTQPTAEQMLW